MNTQTIMEMFADPNLINELTMSEKLSCSLITTVIGMGITFIVLGFIWFTIFLTSKSLEINETLSSRSEKGIREDEIEAVSSPVSIGQRSYNNLVIRKIIMIDGIEGRFIIPTGLMIRRKYC